jgi:arylsulfatase A-like enzyme
VDVLLIVIDTLRADHLGCYGDPEARTPTIDALSRRGAQYRCFAQAPWTLPSVTTILSGLYPAGHGAHKMRRAVPEAVPLLAERFRDAGYATGGFVSHSILGTHYGFSRGFDTYDDSNALGHDAVTSESVTGLAVDWLAEAPGPFFLFLHYFDAHYNYMDHGELTRTADYGGSLQPGEHITAIRQKLNQITPDDVRFLRGLYSGEIRWLDMWIHRLFRAIEERGQDRDLAVLFTADHGEEFLEHGWLGHTRNLRQVLLDVPFVLAGPGVEPGLRRESAMLVDARPTLLRLAGQAPEDGPGAALGAGPPPDRDLYAEVTYDAKEFMDSPQRYRLREVKGINKTADMRSLRHGRWKIVQDRLAESWHLYDLESDPGERRDVAGEQPEELARLRKRLEETTAALPGEAAGQGEEVIVSKESVEKLRALGYVE